MDGENKSQAKAIGELAYSLNKVLEELAVWYGTAVKHVFYPNKDIELRNVQLEAKLKQACDLYNALNGNNAPETIKLNDFWKELHASVRELSKLKAKTPQFDKFNDLTNLQYEMVELLSKMSHEQSMLGMDYDHVTSLPMTTNLLDDLAREMERRARHGKEFSLVVARLDHFPAYKKDSDVLTNLALQYSARIIKKIIRTFDDAYKLSDDTFLISLKHADINGALACVERLRAALKGCDNPDLLAKTDGVSMTYSVTEPLPGDDLEVVMNSMLTEIKDHPDAIDTIIEYVEESPIQQFIKDMDE